MTDGLREIAEQLEASWINSHKAACRITGCPICTKLVGITSVLEWAIRKMAEATWVYCHENGRPNSSQPNAHSRQRIAEIVVELLKAETKA